jgi:hypothetical protein
MKIKPTSLGLLTLLVLSACSSQASSSPSQAAGTSTLPTSTTAAPPSAVLPTGAPFDTSAWFTYRPPDGSFEIKMPGQPTTVSTTLTSTDWASPYAEALVLDPGGKTGFSVGWIDYKPSAIASKSPETILAHGQATQVARISNGTIIDQSQIQLGGHPGRAWTVKFGGGSAITRAFIVDARLYTLQAVVADGDQARGIAFLNSFTLKS